jgi:NhaP-type Na+/H+ or K+/H+ antiporter
VRAGGAFMNSETSVEGRLVENVLKELDGFSERISPTNTVDRVSSIGVLNQMNVEEKRESIKEEFVKALLVSNQTQRLYFVVRSMIMSILGAIITLVVFWQLGTINVIEDFVLGIFTYAICLVLSRLFDKRIVNVSKKIIMHLGEHTKLRDFIVRNL